MGGAGSGTWIRTDTRPCWSRGSVWGCGSCYGGEHYSPECSCAVGWAGGSLAGGSLRLTCQVDRIVLEYRVRIGGADWHSMRQVIPLDWTPCAVIGGKQVWFNVRAVIAGQL